VRDRVFGDFKLISCHRFGAHHVPQRNLAVMSPASVENQTLRSKNDVKMAKRIANERQLTARLSHEPISHSIYDSRPILKDIQPRTFAIGQPVTIVANDL
jgi:hypothetical protein